MVLSLKRWKSRSPPGFAAGAAERIRTHSHVFEFRPRRSKAPRIVRWLGAGWSSPVARQAHNLKVAGSNPAPATNANLGGASRRATPAKARPSSFDMKSCSVRPSGEVEKPTRPVGRSAGSSLVAASRQAPYPEGRRFKSCPRNQRNPLQPQSNITARRQPRRFFCAWRPQPWPSCSPGSASRDPLSLRSRGIA